MKRTPTPAQKAAAQEKRAALIALSLPIQRARKAGIQPYASRTVNESLEALYRQRTNQSEFHTFAGWKEAGFAVEKGAKGFALWGRPMEGRKAESEESAPAAESGEASESAAFSWWPIAYLFHAGQVADANGARPASYNPAIYQAPAPAIAPAPEAAPAPVKLYSFPDAAQLDATLAA